MNLDQERLNAFLGRILVDIGAALSAPLLRIGDRLGLYKEMALAGPVTPAELAERTKTTPRYINGPGRDMHAGRAVRA